MKEILRNFLNQRITRTKTNDNDKKIEKTIKKLGYNNKIFIVDF